jgi:hypothetical protein
MNTIKKITPLKYIFINDNDILDDSDELRKNGDKMFKHIILQNSEVFVAYSTNVLGLTWINRYHDEMHTCLTCEGNTSNRYENTGEIYDLEKINEKNNKKYIPYKIHGHNKQNFFCNECDFLREWVIRHDRKGHHDIAFIEKQCDVHKWRTLCTLKML